MRSWLFVPGDRPERMEKALGLGADALILDLEDSVAPGAKDEARAATAAFLAARAAGGPRCFVRINPFGSGFTDDDLAAVVPARPDGLVLPKAEGARSVAALAALAPGLPILPIATETPAAVFTLGDYGACAAQLAGLTWGAEDLPAAIGASASREADGSYTAPYQVARALLLFGAAAAGVAPIETVYPNIRDEAGLRRVAATAARDGFTGMMAIHPAQVPIINAAFTPSPEAVAAAREIVDAFAANPQAGVLKIGGKMIDAPHLKQAQRVLARAGEAG